MVEWKEIGEIAKRNKGIPITAGQMSELDAPDGNIRVFAAGQTVANINESELPSNCAYKEPSIIVKSRGYVDFVFYDKPFTHKNEMWSYSFVNKQFGKYVYYFLTTKTEFFRKKAKANSVKLPQLCVADTDKFLIPIPSQSEQNKIVDILDTFTSSIENLKEQIALRRKQYEYYRDQLLDLEGKEGVAWKTLEWAFPFIRNGFVGTVTPYFTSEDNGVRYLEGTNIHNGTIADNVKLYVTHEFHKKHIKNELKANDILMVQSGHIGECAVVGDKYKGSNCHALIIMSNGGLCNSKFVVHYFHTIKGYKSLSPAITGGAIKHVLAKKVGKIRIPIPSLAEQSRIVSILDTFEASISNLEAQLKEREKQYEYYRNKLLTFE